MSNGMSELKIQLGELVWLRNSLLLSCVKTDVRETIDSTQSRGRDKSL